MMLQVTIAMTLLIATVLSLPVRSNEPIRHPDFSPDLFRGILIAKIHDIVE